MTGNAAGTFRFQKLEIWKKAIEIGHKLLDVADILEKRKLYRFAEQVRGERMRDRIQESGVRMKRQPARCFQDLIVWQKAHQFVFD